MYAHGKATRPPVFVPGSPQSVSQIPRSTTASLYKRAAPQHVVSRNAAPTTCSGRVEDAATPRVHRGHSATISRLRHLDSPNASGQPDLCRRQFNALPAVEPGTWRRLTTRKPPQPPPLLERRRRSQLSPNGVHPDLFQPQPNDRSCHPQRPCPARWPSYFRSPRRNIRLSPNVPLCKHFPSRARQRASAKAASILDRGARPRVRGSRRRRCRSIGP